MLKNIKELTTLKRDNLWVTLTLILINTLLIAYTLTTYVTAIGSEGVIIKEYLVAVAGLILLLPYIGNLNKKYPIGCLKFSVTCDMLCMLGYAFVSFYPEQLAVLFISTGLLVIGNIVMRGINLRMTSIVVDGCSDYCTLVTGLSALVTGVASLLGLVLMLADVNITVILLLLAITILISRYYKLRVFKVIFGEKDV